MNRKLSIDGRYFTTLLPFVFFFSIYEQISEEMTTAPRGGFDSSSGGVGGGSGSISGLCAAAQSSMADPSILFDLDDFMMATDCGNSCNSNDMLPPSLVSIHAPIKEEPEFDNDDHR